MNASKDRLEIPLSKRKMILALAGAIGFVVLGLWFVVAPPHIQNGFWGNPTTLMVVGYVSIIFFGLCAVLLARKLPDNKPGLIIDEHGLWDNSSGLSAGQVLWSDIDNISVIKISGQKLLMLHLKNPQEYIDRQSSGFKQRMMTMNYKMYGTPLSISANALQIPFHELSSVLTERWQASHSSHV